MDPSLRSLPLRLAFAGSLLCLLTLISGCGGQPKTEAAGPVETRRSPSETQEAAKPADVQTVAVAKASATTVTSPVLPAQTDPAKSAPEGQAAPAEKLKAVAAVAKDAPPTGDEAHRKKIIGKWLQHKEEKRTITVNEDGTATIIAEIDDYRQYIVGKTLQFDVEWTLEDGKLTFVTTGGKPADSIKYITSLYGKTRVYRIIEFIEDRLTLAKDESGEDEPEWTRLAEK